MKHSFMSEAWSTELCYLFETKQLIGRPITIHIKKKKKRVCTYIKSQVFL